MYQKSVAELQQMGAEITTRKIRQQPELWEEAFATYKSAQNEIETFLNRVKSSTDQKIRVVFTGAGTSQYVGDTILPYLKSHGATQDFIFESIGTTDIVSAPKDYLFPDEPTLLVSFARSGNSPESVATVNIANGYVKNIFHLTITCAPDGQLAKNAATEENNFVLLMPARSNDAGFAMTGSYSCMALSALLIFDETVLALKGDYVKALIAFGNEVVAREDEIAAILNRDFDRIVYLGSGSLSGLTREAQLKVLELTAGKIATAFDSSMGFRHGPKSFVNDKTLVFDFMSNDAYTRLYDVDILEEMHGDKIAAAITGVGQPGDVNFSGANFTYTSATTLLPEAYLALADVMFAQTVSLYASIKVGNTPDTPSPSGTVNRVVKGVTIHPFSK